MVEVEEVDGKLLFPLLELELVEENRELEAVEGKVEEREEELVWGGIAKEAEEGDGGFRVTVRMALVEGGNDGLKIGMKFCC